MRARESRPEGNGPAQNLDRQDLKFGSTIARGADHGAMIAADARPWFDTLAWEQAVVRAAMDGRSFAADDLREWFELPDLGNGTGGVLMRAHRAGIIRRVGYRPSRRRSRHGSAVAIWCAGGAA